jgi:transposase
MDMRRSFNGLSAWVQNQLGEDLFSGALFVLTNRQRNRLKILFWDGSGLWCCAKRLERNRFTWPQGSGIAAELCAAQLGALLSGWEVLSKSDWYRR